MLSFTPRYLNWHYWLTVSLISQTLPLKPGPLLILCLESGDEEGYLSQYFVGAADPHPHQWHAEK